MSPPVVVGYLAKVSRLLFDEAVLSTIGEYYGRFGKNDTRTKKIINKNSTTESMYAHSSLTFVKKKSLRDI